MSEVHPADIVETLNLYGSSPCYDDGLFTELEEDTEWPCKSPEVVGAFNVEYRSCYEMCYIAAITSTLTGADAGPAEETAGYLSRSTAEYHCYVGPKEWPVVTEMTNKLP